MLGNTVLELYTINNAITSDSGHKEPVEWEIVFMQKSIWIFGQNWSDKAGITSTNLFGKNFSPRCSDSVCVLVIFSPIWCPHFSCSVLYQNGWPHANYTAQVPFLDQWETLMGHWSGGGREKPGWFSLQSVSGGISGVSVFLPWLPQILFQCGLEGFSMPSCSGTLSSEQWSLLTWFRHVSFCLMTLMFA